MHQGGGAGAVRRRHRPQGAGQEPHQWAALLLVAVAAVLLVAALLEVAWRPTGWPKPPTPLLLAVAPMARRLSVAEQCRCAPAPKPRAMGKEAAGAASERFAPSTPLLACH